MIRDQKSNKHIADTYKNLFRAFNREAVQFLVAKKPCRKSPDILWFAVSVKNLMLIKGLYCGKVGAGAKEKDSSFCSGPSFLYELSRKRLLCGLRQTPK